MKKEILLIPLLLTVSFGVRAQSISPATLNATGGTATISGTEFDWSVGEMTMVSTFINANIIVTQGVLQPTPSATSVPNNSLISTQLEVFPNPATSVVNLRYSSQANGSLTYQLMDETGRVITRHKIVFAPGTTVEQISISELACATYMLEVTVNAGNTAPENISYKIQKLN